MAAATQQKSLGAFYTAEAVAKFLVNWALRSAEDSVLDPSCGDGVFLSAAIQRLRSLGNSHPQVCGVDVDPEALRAARLCSRSSRLVCADFFSLELRDIPAVTAVVGNPPFIRYQSFNGKTRSDALRCAHKAGVELPRLSSSWAPFLVHAAGFLQRDGRLGMVAPAELAHAQYAQEVLRFLIRRFGRITVRMFQKKLFPELSEDTVLLLCEDYGKPCGWFTVSPTESIEGVHEEEETVIPVDIEAVRSGRRRLTHYLLPAKARHLYEFLTEQKGVTKLGEAADVGIGYVTGANDYFHLSLHESKSWGIPARYLRPAILSLSGFQGTALRAIDWRRLREEGKKVFLLALPASGGQQFAQGVLKYLAYGKQQGVPNHFKCRVREPWYAVPHVRVGDAFLSYMSGSSPKLVANGAHLVSPNTLHIVRFAEGWERTPFVAGWHSSLTRLSCELEGHALGGGMLKLEPSEAERVLVALPYPKDAIELVREIDRLLRGRDLEAAMDLGDRRVLRRRFGLSASECITLREAARQLETWRMHK